MGNPRDPGRAKRGTGHRPVLAVVEPAAVIPARSSGVAPGPAWALPPEEVPDGVSRAWCALVEELLPRGLREAQMPGVAAMSWASWQHEQAARMVASNGLVVMGPSGGPIANPALRAMKDAAATWARMAAEYGLTPAARLRLGLMTLEGASLLQSLDSSLGG